MNEEQFINMDWNGRLDVLEQHKKHHGKLRSIAGKNAKDWNVCAVGESVLNLDVDTDIDMAQHIRTISEMVTESYGYDADGDLAYEVDLEEKGCRFSDMIYNNRYTEAKHVLAEIQNLVNDNRDLLEEILN